MKFTSADYTTTKLSGFIIQKGNASETSGDNSFGGGIIFLGTASDDVSLERLRIRNNNAYSGGGGVFIKQVPGGNLKAYLTNCRFEFNTTNGDGGGLSVAEKSVAVLQNCIFYDNDAGGVGGGITTSVSNGTADVSNCTFHANSATGEFIEGATRYGHAIYCSTSMNVHNTIVWGNGSSGLQLDAPDTPSNYFVGVLYSNIQNGGWDGSNNNIAADPLFRDPGNGVLGLLPCSPCIDTGFAGAPAGPGQQLPLLEFDNTDLDEDAADELTPWEFTNFERLVNYRDSSEDPNDWLEMGATEECPGDYDDDGDVDISDLSQFLSQFGSTNCVPPSDCAKANFVCDENDSIGLADLAFLLSKFGTVCSPGYNGFVPDSGSVTIAIAGHDTGGCSVSGFEGEVNDFTFDCMVTIGTSVDDWIGAGIYAVAANNATFRLVPSAGNPPTPGNTEPEKYCTFFGVPRLVSNADRYTNPFPTGAIAGRYSGSGSYVYTTSTMNVAWYDTNTTSNDGPAAIMRLCIDVTNVSGKDTSGGFGSVYFTTGSGGSGDIKVADVTIDVDHKYLDSGSTVLTGAFFVTN